MGESEQCESAGAADAATGRPVPPEAEGPSLHVAEAPGARGADVQPGVQAFEPWYGSGVDVAGAYSQSAWRDRLRPGVWEFWATLGRRLRVDGGFAARPSDLVHPAPTAGGATAGGATAGGADEATAGGVTAGGVTAGGADVGELGRAHAADEARRAALDDVVHAALVELALNGLARRTDDGAWQVRPNCPISPPRVDKSYTVTHYQHLAAAAAHPDDAAPTDPALRPVEAPRDS